MERKHGWQGLLGYLLVGVLGVVLHFLYDWSGQSLFVAPISAVNESIWEHMKLLYMARLAYAVAWWRWQDWHRERWCAWASGTLWGVAAIPLLYYTYTGALGVTADWFNITIYFLAALVASVAEHRKVRQGCTDSTALYWQAMLGVLFVLFTFAPPHIPLLRDPVTGVYGIY